MFYLLEILKLDAALEVLYLNKDQLALSVKDILGKMPFRLSEEEGSMILDKFRADDLVSKKPDQAGENFFITYRGMKFYQKGGYLNASVRNVFKKLFKLLLVIMGGISTAIGIILGLRNLL